MTDPITFSAPDSRRFGIRVYRGRISDDDSLRRALDCEEDVDLMVVRCPVERADLVDRLEARGFERMGTLVTYRGATGRFTPPRPDERLVLRPVEGRDLDPLARLAREAFTDFGGHYHADPRLDSAAATEGYVEWCLSLAANADARVQLAVHDGSVAGFLALVPATTDESEIQLNAVAPRLQRRGIYTTLLQDAGNFLREAGIAHVRVSSQQRNLAPQKVWMRAGLEQSAAHHTFHRWFD